MCLGFPNDESSRQSEAIAGRRSACAIVVRVGGIDVTDQGVRRVFRRKLERVVDVARHGGEVAQGQVEEWGLSPVNNTPIDGGAKVLGDALKLTIVDLSRVVRKLAEQNNAVANVTSRSNVGVKKLTKESAIGKTHLFAEGIVLFGVLEGTFGSIQLG